MFFSEPHVGDATPGYPQERKKIEPYQISSCNPTPTPRLALGTSTLKRREQYNQPQ